MSYCHADYYILCLVKFEEKFEIYSRKKIKGDGLLSDVLPDSPLNAFKKCKHSRILKYGGTWEGWGGGWGAASTSEGSFSFLREETHETPRRKALTEGPSLWWICIEKRREWTGLVQRRANGEREEGEHAAIWSVHRHWQLKTGGRVRK